MRCNQTNHNRMQAALNRKKERLEKYYVREAEILNLDGVKSYSIGSRSLSRYDTALKDVQDAIKKLEDEISELEALLCGGHPRKAVGVIPRDW